MQCPQCGQEVLSEAKFCNQCGQQLRLVCKSCDTDNPSGSRFCYHCGTSLAEPVNDGTRGRGASGASVQTPPHFVGCPRCYANNEPGSAYCFQCGLPFEGRPPSGAPRVSDVPAFVRGRPAGFWIRLVASLVDSLILAILLGMLVAMFFGESAADFYTREDYGASSFFGDVVSALYFTIAVAIWATTVGKRLFGMHVVRRDGSKVGAGRAFARYLAYGLSAIILGIGFIMIGLRQDKRGLHDLICDTVIVRR